MASKELKRAYIAVGADVTEFASALSDIDAKLSGYGKSVRYLNSELKLDPQNIALTGQKTQSLTEQIEALSEKLKYLRENQQKANDAAINGTLSKESYEAYNVEIEKTAKALELANKQLTANDDKLKRLSATTDEAKSAQEKLGVIAATTWGSLFADAIETATAKLRAFIETSIQVGSDFESSMSRVAATMGTTVDQIQDIEAVARQMGATTQFSAKAAADAFNFLAQAGYDTERSVAALPSVLNLAAAGEMGLAEATSLVTNSVSSLGVKEDELALYTDKLAVAAQKTDTDIKLMGQSAITVGGTAKALSGGITEMAAALGIFADNGVKGAEGGTALRNIILELTAPTDKAKEALNKYVGSVADAQGNLRPLNEIFKDLGASLDGLGNVERTGVLREIFNKVDLKSVEAMLANCGGRFDELTAAIDDAEGAAAQMAETMQDNLQGEMKQFDSGLEEMQITIYQTVKPALEALVGLGVDLVSGFNNLGDGAKKLIVALGILGGGAIALKGALNILPVIQGIIGALTATGAAAGTAAGGVAAVGAASAGAAGGVAAMGTASVAAAGEVAVVGAAAGTAAGGVAAFAAAVGAALAAAAPYVVAAAAVVGGIIAVSNAVNGNTGRIEKYTKQYEDAKNEISETEKELSETAKRVKEIQDLGSLTFVEKAELEKLQEVTAQLERQKAALEKQESTALEKAIKNARIELEDLTYDIQNGAGMYGLEDLFGSSESAAKKAIDKLEILNDTFKKGEAAGGDYTAQIAEVNRLLEDLYKQYLGEQKYKALKWDEVLAADEFKTIKQKLTEGLELTADEYTKLYGAMSEYGINTVDIYDQTRALAAAHKEAAEAAAEAAAETDGETKTLTKSIEEISDETKEAVKSIDSLTKGYQTLEAGGELTADSLKDLIDKFPEVARYIKETGDLSLNKGEILKEVAETQKQAAAAELQIQRELLAEEAEIAGKRVLLLRNVRDAAGLAVLNKTKEDLAETQKALDQLDAYIATINGISINPKDTEDKDDKSADKAAKEAEKAAKEARDEELALLKWRKDMGEISEAEYYDALAKYRDKYFAEGTEEWRKYTLEIQQHGEKLKEKADAAARDREFADLEYYHSKGLKSDERYYADKGALIDKYYADDLAKQRAFELERDGFEESERKKRLDKWSEGVIKGGKDYENDIDDGKFYNTISTSGIIETLENELNYYEENKARVLELTEATEAEKTDIIARYDEEIRRIERELYTERKALNKELIENQLSEADKVITATERLIALKKKAASADSSAPFTANDELSLVKQITAALDAEIADYEARLDTLTEAEQEAYKKRLALRAEYDDRMEDLRFQAMKKEITDIENGLEVFIKANKKQWDEALKEADEWYKAQTKLAKDEFETFKAAQKEKVDEAKTANKKLTDDLRAEYDVRIAAEKTYSDAQIFALNARLKALDDIEQAHNRERQDTDYADKIRRLTEQLAYEHDDANRYELQKELAKLNDEKSEVDWKRGIDDEREALRTETDALKSAVNERVALLTAERDERIAAANAAAEANIAAIEAETLAEETAYEIRLETLKTENDKKRAELEKFYKERERQERVSAQLQRDIASRALQGILSDMWGSVGGFGDAGMEAGRAYGQGLLNGINDSLTEMGGLNDRLGAGGAGVVTAGGTLPVVTAEYNIDFNQTINSQVLSPSQNAALTQRAGEELFRRLAS